jgi:hypothetical protein
VHQDLTLNEDYLAKDLNILRQKTDTGPKRPILPFEFQTGKELLIQKLRISENKKIETKNALIRKNGCIQYIKKGGI